MKKILSMIIFLSLIIILPVRALDNKLVFTNTGDRLYYKTEIFDENTFIKHLDMVPGKSYKDELGIENDTNYDYKLYMKVKLKEQSAKAQELLKNIEMIIYLDGKLLYEGYADGKDYSSTGIDFLKEAIFIGEYKAGSNGQIEVNTKLKDSFTDINNHEQSIIDWEFYAEYNDLIVPINPDTGMNTNKYLTIILISLLIVILLMLMYIFIVEKRKITIKRL